MENENKSMIWMPIEQVIEQQRKFSLLEAELFPFHYECDDCYGRDSFKNWKEEKIGFDRKFIKFIPFCDTAIGDFDIIENIEKGFKLQHTKNNYFVLVTDNPNDFITNHDLFTEYKLL